MANIYISKSFNLKFDSNKVLSYLIERLSNAGHSIYTSAFNIMFGEFQPDKNSEIVCDVFVFYFDESNISYSKYIDEFKKFSKLAEGASFTRLVIPVVSPAISSIPDFLIKHIFTKLEGFDDNSLDALAFQVLKITNQFFGRKLDQFAQKEEIKQNIENEAPLFVKEAKKRLEARALDLRDTARQYFVGAYFLIVCGLGVASWIYSSDKSSLIEKPDTLVLVFFFIKSLVIMTLFIAVVKYSFTLGKSYMHEALKIEDRIHAISFGEFYLNVYKDEVNSQELKDVFRDWNINNTNTAFLNQNANEFDPKFIEKSLEVLEKIKSITKLPEK